MIGKRTEGNKGGHVQMEVTTKLKAGTTEDIQRQHKYYIRQDNRNYSKDNDT